MYFKLRTVHLIPVVVAHEVVLGLPEMEVPAEEVDPVEGEVPEALLAEVSEGDHLLGEDLKGVVHEEAGDPSVKAAAELAGEDPEVEGGGDPEGGPWGAGGDPAEEKMAADGVAEASTVEGGQDGPSEGAEEGVGTSADFWPVHLP